MTHDEAREVVGLTRMFGPANLTFRILQENREMRLAHAVSEQTTLGHPRLSARVASVFIPAPGAA